MRRTQWRILLHRWLSNISFTALLQREIFSFFFFLFGGDPFMPWLTRICSFSSAHEGSHCGTCFSLPPQRKQTPVAFTQSDSSCSFRFSCVRRRRERPHIRASLILRFALTNFSVAIYRPLCYLENSPAGNSPMHHCNNPQLCVVRSCNYLCSRSALQPHFT